MPVGFEVIDDLGRRQVVDSAPLLTFKDKKVVNGSSTVYLTDKFLMAAKPSNNEPLLLTTFRVSASTIDTEDNERYAYRTVGKGEFIRFDYGVAPISAGNYGLEVFNENGVLRFSSHQKPLKILDFISISDLRTIDGNVYWSKSYAGKEVAVITQQYPIWNEGSNIITAAAFKRDSSITIEKVIEEVDGSITSGLQKSYTGYYIVVDVTGF